MFRGLALAFLLLAVSGRELIACSGRAWNIGDPVENETVSSANGRYIAVIRSYDDVPDFTSRPYGSTGGVPVGRVAPEGSIIVALYETLPGGRWLAAEVPVLREHMGTVLVADDGRHLVTVRYLGTGGCGPRAEADDPFVTVYRTDGSHLPSIQVRDLLGWYDLFRLTWDSARPQYTLRHEGGREVFVFGVAEAGAERRVDVVSGRLLDERAPIYPYPVMTAGPVPGDAAPAHWVTSTARDCAPGRANVRLDSAAFFARALETPLPDIPEIAVKARIRGTVRVEVLVSAEGTVACARVSGLPFGISSAVADAVPAWRFAPMVIDGRPVAYAGEVLVRVP